MTVYLSSLVFRALFPLISAVPGGNAQTPVLREEVDLIEFNHYFDDEGRHAYDQVIFYEWSPDYRRFHVIAWTLVERDLNRMPRFDHAKKRYVVRWRDRDFKTQREVNSKLFRESWSQSDPERDNKRLMEEKYRLSLLPQLQRPITLTARLPQRPGM